MSTRVKVLTVILVVLVLVAAGLVYWVFGVAGGIIKDPGSAFDKTGADQLADDTGSYKFDTDIVNILLWDWIPMPRGNSRTKDTEVT